MAKVRFKDIIIRIISALCGWGLLTIFNFLPLWLEMPGAEFLKVGGYDVNIMEEHTFATGLFTTRLAENGNLQVGGALISNDVSAYYTVGETICELDLEIMESRDLAGTAHVAPQFCDDKYYISTGYINQVSVGTLGDGSPADFMEKWYDEVNSFDKVQFSLFQLLKRSQSEELTVREMAKLVGYTTRGYLLGWDGNHAVFWAEDKAKGLVLFQFIDETGIANVLPATCTDFGGGMVTGKNILYCDGGLLKTLDIETLEEKTISDSAYPIVWFNYMNIDGHCIVVWIGNDGMHTLDLDYGNMNFVEGDWVTDYRGLYIWKNHIILLHRDRGFYKWDYTV